MAHVTQTPNGTEVILTDAAWDHICANHPEIAPYLSDILITVNEPDATTRDQRDGRIRLWRRGVGPSRWIMVVVDFNEAPARIITAFANRKDPR